MKLSHFIRSDGFGAVAFSSLIFCLGALGFAGCAKAPAPAPAAVPAPIAATAPAAPAAPVATPPGWAYAEEIVNRIHAPTFPAHAFPITDFGAVAVALPAYGAVGVPPALPAGAPDSTAAIRKAIEACHAAGGGTVVVPDGVFLTGAVRLLSNVELHLSAGAVLRFSTDSAAYPMVFTRWEGTECMNYSALIYAYQQQNIAVTGTGTLDGAAADDNWWGWVHGQRAVPAVAATATTPAIPARPAAPGRSRADSLLLIGMSDRGVPPEQRIFGPGHFLRPNFIQTNRCQNVLIDGVTIIRSPMWELHPLLCTNVTIRDVKISTLGTNNDGCDPESCRDVLVDHCNFATGDDCMAIKSGRNDDGRRVNVPVEDMVIRNCVMQDGHAGVAIGSEISGSCRNVYIEDCTMNSENLDRALRLKSNATRGGVIEDIFMRRIAVGHVSEALLTVDFLYEEGAKGKYPPIVRNIFIDQVTVKSTPRLFYMRGFAGATIDGIHVSHSTIGGVTAAEVVQHAQHIDLDDVQINPLTISRSLSTRVGP